MKYLNLSLLFAASVAVCRGADTCLNSKNDKTYGLVSSFDIFCFDEITVAESFSITGRIAAKNAINISNVTVNDANGQDCSNHENKYAIYTDKLTMGNGQIHGGVHYGTKYNIPDYMKEELQKNHCAISNDSSENLDFDGAEKRMIEISQNLADSTANAVVEDNAKDDSTNKKLVLSKDIKEYVVEVDNKVFNPNGAFEFTIVNNGKLNPKDVTIVFNVKGKSFTLSNANYVFNGFEDRIIWNMPDVTQAEFTTSSIYGLLLAPKAHVKLHNGNLFGKSVSKSFETDNVSIQNASFTGCVPTIEEEEPAATSTKPAIYSQPTELPTGPYKNVTVCDDENIETKEINSDIVFIFDESASMCKYIDAMRKKLNDFINELSNVGANARFAVIGFGGAPRIYSPFTDDVKSVVNAFKKLNCKEGGQESGLEAIRMFLNGSDKFINKVNSKTNYNYVNDLKWRSGSTKTIILVTDEDSDLPIYEENRNDLQIKAAKNNIHVPNYYKTVLGKEDIDKFVGFPYYIKSSNVPKHNPNVYFEPTFSPAFFTAVKQNGEFIYTFYRNDSPLVLGEPYQKEVDETAKLITSQNIQLFMLLNDNLADSQGKYVANSQFNEYNPYFKEAKLTQSDDSSTITAQYGNPFLDSFQKTEFDRDALLKSLAERKQEKSLQGQILAKEGFCRAFNMKEFTTGQSEKMVELFYKTVISTVQKCKVIPVPIEVTTTVKPEPTTTTVEVEETTTTEAEIETSTVTEVETSTEEPTVIVETNTAKPEPEPEEKPSNKTIPIVIGASVGAAALVAAGATYYRSASRTAGNQLLNATFDDNLGMQNPLYEGTVGQSENPLYEANMHFDSLEENNLV